MESQSTNNWVRVPATLTENADDSLLETYKATPPKPHVRGMVDRLHTNESLLNQKTILTIDCWNVRTLSETGTSEILLHEVANFRWESHRTAG